MTWFARIRLGLNVRYGSKADLALAPAVTQEPDTDLCWPRPTRTLDATAMMGLASCGYVSSRGGFYVPPLTSGANLAKRASASQCVETPARDFAPRGIDVIPDYLILVRSVCASVR
jgi:hypothetical protein